ncbi:MAG: general secretion pathway protein GspK [Pseudomonadota bacterium]|nr:general secretion pathway protein GspK [Pseudomonadota bacterium]
MTSGRADDGFVLIAVLWMLAALAALASAYAVYAARTAPSAALPEERLRAEAALRAGVELCAFRQLAWPKPARPDAGAFSTQVGTSRLDVVYRSESARIDLNAAPRAVLAGLFQQLGATGANAGFLADRIVAWRGRLKDSERRQEAAIYAKAGLSYGPLGAPFDNALDIALLPGMSPALVARALGFVTVFGAAKIDPLIADTVVLAALPGMTPRIANNFLKARDGARPDAAALAQLAGPVKDLVGLDPSDYVRAEIVVNLNGRLLRADVVLKLTEGAPAPYEVVFWRDDFDGAGS